MDEERGDTREENIVQYILDISQLHRPTLIPAGVHDVKKHFRFPFFSPGVDLVRAGTANLQTSTSPAARLDDRGGGQTPNPSGILQAVPLTYHRYSTT